MTVYYIPNPRNISLVYSKPYEILSIIIFQPKEYQFIISQPFGILHRQKLIKVFIIILIPIINY
jgi:hypothetical protein